MPVLTQRWNDPFPDHPGLRVLVCRYRPRGLLKADQTWDLWEKELGPSEELHAAVYGNRGRTPVSWEVYRQRYLREMLRPAARDKIAALARRVGRGETLTLLCSSQCVREERCHRSLLKGLIERAAADPGGAADGPT